jgi:hypothetical protein
MSFDPGELLQGNHCVYGVSKDLNGQVTLVDGDYRNCASPACDPLVQQQFWRLEATSNPRCDDQPPGLALDGMILVRFVATVFTGPRESLRGVHAGQFGWTPTVGGLPITGTLEGISNVGVLRDPIFSAACERCHEPGIVSGHLFGTGKNLQGAPATDFRVEAMYRLAWDPLAWDPTNPQVTTAPVRGTLEGVLVIACQ